MKKDHPTNNSEVSFGLENLLLGNLSICFEPDTTKLFVNRLAQKDIFHLFLLLFFIRGGITPYLFPL